VTFFLGLRAGLAIALFLPLAVAALKAPDFAHTEPVTLDQVIDGRTLRLVDGRLLRLAGIDTPMGPAKSRLAQLVAGRRLELAYDEPKLDRYGRLIAHLFADGEWVEGTLLERGLARVATSTDDRAGAAMMLAFERRARGAGRGLWRDPHYAVRDPGEGGRFADSFQLVEGEVAEVSTLAGAVVMAFAGDETPRLTLRMDGAALALFREEGIDLQALSGKRVRVRGWIHGTTRPTLDITHPEQIERLRKKH